MPYRSPLPLVALLGVFGACDKSAEAPGTDTDGWDDASSTTDDADTDAPLGLCGNEFLDPGEVCDDGPWTRCSDCRGHVDIGWRTVGTAPGQAGFHDVVVDGGGVAYATGSQTVGASPISVGTTNLVVQRFDPDGTPGWSYTFDDGGPLATGQGIALHPTGDLIVVGESVVGQIEGDTYEIDLLVMRLAKDGESVAWVQHFAGLNEDDLTDRGQALLVARSGEIVAAGKTAADWVFLRLSDDGDILDTVIHTPAEVELDITGFEPTDAGYVVSATAFGGGRLATFDPELAPIASTELELSPLGVAVEADGTIIVTGTTANFGGSMVIARFSPDLELIEEVEHEIPGGLTKLHDAVIAPGGDIIVAGGTGDGPWLARLDPALRPRWALHETPDPGWWRALALQPSGTIVLAGLSGDHTYVAGVVDPR